MNHHKKTATVATTALSVAIAFVMLLTMADVAIGSTSAPGWRVFGYSIPTDLTPGGKGEVELFVYNLGSADAQPGGKVTDFLPEGLTATRVHTSSPGRNRGSCEINEPRLVTCDLENMPAGTHALDVTINVDIAMIPPGKPVNRTVVSGGGALRDAVANTPLNVDAVPAGAGFANVAVWATNPDGTSDTQAGSHPYDLTAVIAYNTTAVENEGRIEREPANGEVRNLNVDLPPGLVGDPQAVAQCPREDLDKGYIEQFCPPNTQIGENISTVNNLTQIAGEPVYNMVPPPGVAAQFAFNESGVHVFIDSGVQTGTDNAIISHVDNIPERFISLSTTTIWGVPGDVRHNSERCIAAEATSEPCPPVGVPATSLLTMPTSCGAAPEFSFEFLGTWQDEGLIGAPATYSMRDEEDNPAGLTGCEKLHPFKPEISIAPDTSYADTPAGLSVDVKMPQGLNPEELQTPGLKGTKVVLPEGVAINPGQATGLVACQPSQEALGKLSDGASNEEAPSCPSASKVGTVEVSSSLLRDKMIGNVYILGSNPPHLQLLVAASADGVNLKLVGDVQLNEQTGQLTTTFDNTPDVPFTDFKLNFSGGAQAALATPTGCGTYESMVDFTPWSTPFIGDALDSSRFAISAGPNGTPCASPMPFSPAMTAGATTDQAGGYTNFTMLLQRGDEQQRIKSLSFKTPEGLLGVIAKVPLCEEPQAAQGACSAASQIGHTVVGAGPGPYPFYIPQASAPPAPIYLTGPYKGAPFGLSIVVPLVAGPFNLGTEVVRAKLEVDPLTSQVTITTDPLPQSEQGIPADLRLINAVIDRPEFMFNPTDCAPMSFSGAATSVEGATAGLGSHFQVGSCQSLKFKPDFKASTTGKTSRKTGAGLDVKLVYPKAAWGTQANIAKVKVDLPKQLPSRLTTLQKACPDHVFEANPADCPAASRVGTATVRTPLLPVPLSGPSYFVSHGARAFPDLIVVLQGDGVMVHLRGETFISKKGITSSTYRSVPDVPFDIFELNLPKGPYSALANNGNPCNIRGGLEMPTVLTAQNGLQIEQSTKISVTGCPKTKKKAKPKRGTRKKT